jgi:hypothetical protein
MGATPLKCGSHKENGMIDLTHKKCQIEGCITRPTFGIEGGKATRCRIHKEEGMIDVVNKKCFFEGCTTSPVFGHVGGRPLSCANHKHPDMIDLLSKLCEVAECNVRASFGIKGCSPSRCVKHKTEEMVHKSNNLCQGENCTIRASFGFNGEKPTRCACHKIDGMIDLVSKKCEMPECNTHAVYGIESGKPLRCNKHKEEGMMDVKSKMCEIDGCGVRASFGFDGGRKIRCAEHKTNDMLNLVSKMCTNGCGTVAQKSRYKGYCLRCFMYLFPNEPIVRHYKIKEKHMTDFLLETFPDNIDCTDAIIQGGCSKRRPDCLIECYTHSIIVECDENQHDTYDDTCENKRLMELFQDLGNRPLVMIRFNPDAYTENGNKVPSCFRFHASSGVPIIADKTMWENRLNVLKEIIEKQIVTIPEKEVSVIELFHDV